MPLNEAAFEVLKDGVTPRAKAGSKNSNAPAKYKSKSARNLAATAVNPNLSAEQSVLTLRSASTHPHCRHVFKSAGLIDVEGNEKGVDSSSLDE